MPVFHVLFLHAAHGYAANDVLGQENVDDQDRDDGEEYKHINLAHIELQIVGAAQLGDEDGQGLFVSRTNDQRGNEVIVPRADEGEDSLDCYGRLHYRQDHLVEDPEFAGPVYTRSLNHGEGQIALHIREHEVKDNGRGHRGYDQGEMAVHQA